MKTLYMVMCHKNLNQVIMLLDSLASVDNDIVVHIDSYVSDNEYNDFCENVKFRSNVFIADTRLHGVLDDRSLVDIVFAMLDRVEKENLKYEYYCLMSGQDFPIKPLAFIKDELEKNYPMPFIDCTPYDKDNWVFHKFKSRYSIIRFNSFLSYKFSKKNPIRKVLRAFAVFAQKVAEKTKHSSYELLAKKGVDLYGGSAWWILPDVAINYIYNEYKENSEIVKMLLETYTPEETFFQIMTKRSPVKDKVEINPKDMVAQNCKTWAYFSDEGKPFKGHPYVFTINEFDKLKKSDCWFARKFDIEQDMEIVGKICKELL